jgi:peptide-methionine (S)-S-oxide reductase
MAAKALWLVGMLACFGAAGPSPAAAADGYGANAGEGGQTMAKATFAAGCFWGVEAAFRALDGVTATRVGYTGGAVERPSYEDVCGGDTGHAEAVEVMFDPARVSYEELLDVFWKSHDPTTLNRQGPDIGSQYRSAIFVHSAEQRAAAEASKARLQESGTLRRPVATEILEAQPFFEAEDYHQQYLEKRGLASCHIPR